MTLKVLPLDFLGQGALLQPKDPWLHDLAVDYCARELKDEVNLSQFNKVWVTAELDDSGKPMKIHGICGYVMRVDISMFRATHPGATAKMHHRLHQYFADQGILGHDVFIYLNEKETDEQRCANWKWEMEAAGAVPADRYKVVVSPK